MTGAPWRGGRSHRGVADVIAREAEGERAERLTRVAHGTAGFAPDWEDEFEDRPAEEVIAIICRDLGLDPVRGTVKSPLPNDISQAELDAVFPPSGGARAWQTPPPPPAAGWVTHGLFGANAIRLPFAGRTCRIGA